jgi:hypothetical protein
MLQLPVSFEEIMACAVLLEMVQQMPRPSIDIISTEYANVHASAFVVVDD